MTDNPSKTTGDWGDEKRPKSGPQVSDGDGTHLRPDDTRERLATENQTLRERVDDLEATLASLQEELAELKGETGTENAGVADPGTSESADETPELVTSGGQPTKVIGRLSDRDGIGVLGEATGDGTASRGVLGVTQSSDDGGTGVRGEATASSGTTYGVYGVTSSSDGYGLATPDDVRIQGRIDTDETDFVVDAGTQSTGGARNVVQGHTSNAVTDGVDGATVAGGGLDDGTNTLPNHVHDNYGTIGGGYDNQAGSDDGNNNSAKFATVAGGKGNSATETDATVGGGRNNEASGFEATVAGGENNLAGAVQSTVGGGEGNVADTKVGTTVAGGVGNQAINRWATVGGGQNNIADADNATVSGGDTNVADTQNATVGGGNDNQATGGQSVVAGGSSNEVSGVNAAVGGGYNNAASARMATVPGGRANEASGEYSFATGRGATANNDGAIVFGDSTTTPITSSLADVALFQQRVDIGDGAQSGVRLLVEGDSAVDDYLFRVIDSGSTKFLVEDNGGTSVGTFDSPPADGLRVGGKRSIDKLGAGIYLDYSQQVDHDTQTKVDFNNLRFATTGSFDNGTFTADLGGRYLVTTDVTWRHDFGWDHDDYYEIEVFKNGSRIMKNGGHSQDDGLTSIGLTRTVSLSPNDELWVEVRHTAGESVDLDDGSDLNTFEVIHLG